jgi:hypothetical protein
VQLPSHTKKKVFSPNPFSDVVHLNVKMDNDFTLVISRMDGKMIYLHTFPAKQERIELHEIPNGHYIFKVIATGKTYEEKMIKQK